MKTKHVTVEPYNKAWQEAFLDIKTYLETYLKEHNIGIEHVGSTSVVGLAAKPIIDIDVVIESEEVFQEVKKELEKIGYHHEGDLGITGREAFKYDHLPHLMKHHLYVCTKDSYELKRHLTFRDHLRNHQKDRDQYSEVKLKAAKNHPLDIDGYINEKEPFIKNIYRKLNL
ncbi:MAG: hypothetical protein CVV61_02985 [Tenericutes bacterium HGW-Tenericutes-6]|nr:MAG: hypothetical protein CVV61_02985 [Tenericutes bacterium HGW-Tenericutes-6]